MTFRNTQIDYERSEEATKWLEEEISEQIERYKKIVAHMEEISDCLLYTSPSPRDLSTSRMPSSA